MDFFAPRMPLRVLDNSVGSPYRGDPGKEDVRTSVNYWKNERYKTILFFKLEKCVLQITYMPCQLKNLPLSETSFLNFPSGSNAHIRCPFLVYAVRTSGGGRPKSRGE